MALVKKATVTKKAAVTKAPKKASKKKALAAAEGPACFWVRDGLILATLTDLQGALSSIDDETYFHHVTPERNDFADWVESVLGEKKCAAALRKAKGKKAASTVVARSLAAYVE